MRDKRTGGRRLVQGGGGRDGGDGQKGNADRDERG